jgi:hypothetical protein
MFTLATDVQKIIMEFLKPKEIKNYMKHVKKLKLCMKN